MLSEFLNWYLAPWRRIGRVEFGVWVLVASLPGFLLSVLGFVDGVAGWLAPLNSLMGLGQSVQNAQTAAAAPGGIASLAQMAGAGPGSSLSQLLPMGALAPASSNAAPVVAAAFDWGTFVNNSLQLLLLPLCRMRLRDMGKEYPVDLIVALLLNIAAFNHVLACFGVDGLAAVGGGWLAGMVNFWGFMWLCTAKSRPKVRPYETIPPPGPSFRP